MARETFTRESFWAELEELGEEEVRTRVSTGTYSSGNKKRELAQQWLSDSERARNEASQSEQIDIARSAKDAAWEAAKEARDAKKHARIANKIATAALAMAIIAMIIAWLR